MPCIKVTTSASSHPGISLPGGSASVGASALSILACTALAVVLASCAIVPRDGPTSEEIRSSALAQTGDPNERLPYALVNLSPSVLGPVNAATANSVPSFASLPRGGRNVEDVRISVGDLVSVTIFEAAAGGLFIPNEAGSRSGNFVQVPVQQVDGSGFISVPYAGNVKVAGTTARAAGTEIAQKLASRAIEPQVVVSLNERRGNNLNVLGEVNQPARFPLDPGGIYLTGAIARAGGSRYPAYETVVTIQRGARSYRSLLSSVIRNPAQNVAVEPGDTVFLSREPRYALVFGATPDPSSANTRKINFDNDNMTLAEGLAKANGLSSVRADPRAVFLFRLESRSQLARLGIDPTPYRSELVPTVYALDLSKADGIFLMNQLNLRDKDVVVTSDSPVVDYLKFVNIVNQTLLTPTNIATAVTNAAKN